DPGCLSTPNPTGDLIINLFLPKKVHIDGYSGCGQSLGFHIQVPSNAIGYPILPLAGSQGRPIYVAVTRLECADSIADAMITVSHELMEAATNPFPFGFWATDAAPDGLA